MTGSRTRIRWHRPLLGQGLQDIITAIEGHSDREAAIVGHALVESALESAVKFHLVEGFDSRMLKPGGVLGSFYPKLAIAHAFAIIPTDFKKDLDIINDIRNKFAHSVDQITFDTKSDSLDIPKECGTLTLHETYNTVLSWIGATIEELDPRMQESREGIWLTDASGAVGAIAAFTKDEIQTNKGRYITCVKLSWIILESLSIQRSSKCPSEKTLHDSNT